MARESSKKEGECKMSRNLQRREAGEDEGKEDGTFDKTGGREVNIASVKRPPSWRQFEARPECPDNLRDHGVP